MTLVLVTAVRVTAAAQIARVVGLAPTTEGEVRQKAPVPGLVRVEPTRRVRVPMIVQLAGALLGPLAMGTLGTEAAATRGVGRKRRREKTLWPDAMRCAPCSRGSQLEASAC